MPLPPDDVADPNDPSCSDGAIVGRAGVAGRVVPATCRRWDCPHCGARKARALASRIMAAPGRRLITLTLTAAPGRDVAEYLDVANDAWRTLWKRIKRVQGAKASGYVKVVELTQKGTPHLHIIADCGYISQAALSHAWRELTDSPVVDIRAVHSQVKLAAYLAKYLTKATDTIAHRRKWSASADYLPATPPPQSPEGQPSPTWHWTPGTGLRWLSTLAAAGYRPDSSGWWWPPAFNTEPDARPAPD